MNLRSQLCVWFLSVVLMCGMSIGSYATHLRAGEIIVERVNCNSLTFRITVTVFTNTINTTVLFGGKDDFLDFGDGSDPDGDGRDGIKVPETPNTQRPDLGEGIATASFTILHTYSGFQEYIISYSEPNRNDGVVNMAGSVNTHFYIETKIIVDPFLGCNNTPKLLVPPIDRACTGVAWFHNPGAFDPDGDSLSYELVIPFRDENTTVVDYRDPDAAEFYTNYGGGNEEGTGTPTFDINALDGTLKWDAPGMEGEYNIAFIIKEWRFIDGEWFSTGFVRRDMQIIVEDCDNERPDLIVPEDVCIEAGETLDAIIYGIDPDNDPVKIEAFSQIFGFAPAQSPATYTPNDGEFYPSSPPAELHFTWKTECFHVKEQPYQVVFKITDKSPTGSKLVTFKTWFIRVVGPKPEWVDASLDLSTRSASLEWESYVCQNAETLQVWRRVDSFEFIPDTCQTGMPDFLGYEQIAALPVKVNNVPTTSYIDTNQGKGLASGARYCYRLVAVFPRPTGGESYVSEEICIGPILADEPIITNVTIDRTSTTNGVITVKWLEPFEADPVQFPPPYKYDVYRAEGFAGDGGLTKVAPGITTLSFTEQGLNTEEKVYNYRIIGFDSNNNPLDTSATASTVRLEAKSQLKKIELTWSAFVPWSNLRQLAPNKHLIYRGPEGATESELERIDSVDVTAGGFTYVDEGQWNNTPLVDNQIYCYRVMTRGGYGNPLIGEPLLNFSQKICAQPGDEKAPCKPETPMPVEPLNCADYISKVETCNLNVFSNTIRWLRGDDPACRNDISFYRIYVAVSSTADSLAYELLAEVKDTVYIHTNLPSFARCYKITAVDRSGNESPRSEQVCFDNCPYYELPNVFSPDSGDDCNNRFSAFSTNERYRTVDEEGNITIACGGVVDQSRCARFVNSVVFKVFNRWGKEVYSYQSGSERTIYIDWDGRANDRSELAAGIYYFVAEVTFDTVDPDTRNKIIKGWVHLIR